MKQLEFEFIKKPIQITAGDHSHRGSPYLCVASEYINELEYDKQSSYLIGKIVKIIEADDHHLLMEELKEN